MGGLLGTVAVSILVFTLVSCAGAAGQELDANAYYVDANSIGGSCSDDNPGTATEPFCTLETAAITVNAIGGADDITVYVREGTYYPYINGTNMHWYNPYIIEEPNNLIHVSNYPGEKVVVDFTGEQGGIKLTGGDIILEGFEITNFSEYGIMTSSGAPEGGRFQILNNTIHTCADDAYSCSGMNVMAGDETIIRGNLIYNLFSIQMAEESGIRFDGSQGLIEDNVVHDNVNNGIMVYGEGNMVRRNSVYNHFITGQATGIRAGGSGNLIHNNTLYDNFYNIHLISCNSCTVSGNLVYSTGQIGLGVMAEYSPAADILANTIAYTPNFGVETSQSSNFELKNNVIYGSGEGALRIISEAFPSYVSDYNLFHSVYGDLVILMGIGYGKSPEYTFGHYQNESGQDANSLTLEEPPFVNADTFDFRPRADSPLCSASDTGGYIGALPCEEAAIEPEPEPEPTCTPDWGCTEWSDCVNSTIERVCYDWNECGTNESKPDEQMACFDEPDVIDTEPPVTDKIGDNETVEPDLVGTGDEADTYEPAEVIENFSTGQMQIEPDRPATVDIDKTNIGLSSIQINVRQSVTDAVISVDRISSKPKEISANATGIAYQYLNISHENLENKDIDLITISFDVNRSWLEEHNANKSGVYLSRYVINQWTRLPTRLVNETSDSVRYKAISPGLSMFSIMAGSVLQASNRTCVPFDMRCEGNRLEQCNNLGQGWSLKQDCEYGCSDIKGCLDAPEDEAASPWTLIIIIMVLVVVLAVAGFYFQSKRETLTEEIREMHRE